MIYTRCVHKICIKNRGKGDSVKILIPFPLLFQKVNTLTKIAKEIQHSLANIS